MLLFCIVLATLLSFSIAQSSYETHESELIEDYGNMTLIRVPKSKCHLYARNRMFFRIVEIC